MIIGIYKITNKINNKVYIGQSINVERRLEFDHKKTLIENKHKNKHLQLAVNKYGIDNFIFEILEECSEDKLNERENYWIEYYNCYRREYGYNHIIGEFYKPMKLTIKDREIISKIFKNNPYISKTEIAKKYNISCSTIYGILKEFNIPKPKKINSEETKQKIRNNLKGRKLSKEHYDNVKSANQRVCGRTDTTEEQIKEIIELLLQGFNNIEIQNMTNINYGTINGIRNKKTWKLYTEDLEFPKVKAPDSGKGNSKLSNEEVIKIVNLILQKLTNKEIIEKTNIPYIIINGIRNKKTYKELTKDINFPIVKCKNQYK